MEANAKALRRIREAEDTGATALDLSHIGDRLKVGGHPDARAKE